MPPRLRDWLEVIAFIAVVSLIWIAVPVQADADQAAPCTSSRPATADGGTLSGRGCL